MKCSRVNGMNEFETSQKSRNNFGLFRANCRTSKCTTCRVFDSPSSPQNRNLVYRCSQTWCTTRQTAPSETATEGALDGWCLNIHRKIYTRIIRSLEGENFFLFVSHTSVHDSFPPPKAVTYSADEIATVFSFFFSLFSGEQPAAVHDGNSGPLVCCVAGWWLLTLCCLVLSSWFWRAS